MNLVHSLIAPRHTAKFAKHVARQALRTIGNRHSGFLSQNLRQDSKIREHIPFLLKSGQGGFGGIGSIVSVVGGWGGGG
jgi:hypothetical protein